MYSAIHYHPEDVDVPSGFTPEDMDWMVLTWDFRKITPWTRTVAQIVMVPGALLVRRGTENSGSWRIRSASPPDGVEVIDRKDLTQPLSASASQKTEALLEEGFQMTVKPYAFVIDRDEYPTWKGEIWSDKLGYIPMNTLGDLVINRPNLVLRELFNETFEHRKKQVKHRWKDWR